MDTNTVTCTHIQTTVNNIIVTVVLRHMHAQRINPNALDAGENCWQKTDRYVSSSSSGNGISGPPKTGTQRPGG